MQYKTKKQAMNDKAKEPKIFKVVMLGDGGVGKSAITMQFVSNIFLDFHDATIEDAYQTQCVVDSQPVIIDILDTAAQNEIQTSLKEQYMRLGDCFVGVYAINDINSFSSLRNNMNMLKRIHHFKPIPLVIVGNKLDLSKERQISTVEGLALAKELDCPFFEASANDRVNIEDIYIALTRQFLKKDMDNERDLINGKKPTLNRFRKYVNKKISTLNPLNSRS